MKKKIILWAIGFLLAVIALSFLASADINSAKENPKPSSCSCRAAD